MGATRHTHLLPAFLFRWPSLKIHNYLTKCLRTYSESVIGLILPPACADCGEVTETDSLYPDLCSECRQNFCSAVPSCSSCGLPVKTGMGCFACLGKKFAFDQVFSLGNYEGKLAEAIVKTKSQSGQSLAFAVGRELGRHLTKRTGCKDIASQFDIVTCVPKHWTKRFFAGVNGPEVIMEGLSHATNLKSAADLLQCSRRIRKQSLLSPNQRRRNVRKAWSVSPDYSLNEANVLIVDDTMTTGATAHEAAKALKAGGASHVTVAVVGRAE